jgi:hypothetical protein
MPTKNQRKARQQALSKKSNNFSLVKEDIESLMEQTYDNALKDIGSFRATVLSIERKLLYSERSGRTVANIVNGNRPANYYEVRLRPEWFKTPAPWTLMILV